MSKDVRSVLLFCLPALFVGLALRVVLTWQMPYALYLPDSKDYLTTVIDYLREGKIAVHGKKTFLTPFLFAIPFVLHIPALAAIAAFQHLLGLGIVLLSGILCRLWFDRWRWFIVPVTLLVAVNPSMLWYEHVIMGETVFAFCVMLMLVGATVFVLRRDWTGFGLLLAGVFLAAAARPEGKLFLGFGLMLTGLVYWGQWRRAGLALGLFALFSVFTLRLTSTDQPGLLLLTSLVHWTPEKLWCAPGLAERLRPISNDVNRRWREEHDFAEAKHRKRVSDAVKDYLHSQNKKDGKKEVARFSKRVGLEIFFRSLHRAPHFVYLKYKKNAQTLLAGRFDEYEMWEKQKDSYDDSNRDSELLSAGLTGRARTLAELGEFAEAHYHPERMEWFRQWAAAWERVNLRWATPSRLLKGRNIDRGIPFVQILAMVGLLAAVLRFDRLQPLHAAWLCGLLMFGFALILTAPPKSRFTFVFEPFWTFYPLFLIDTILSRLPQLRAKLAGRPVAS